MNNTANLNISSIIPLIGPGKIIDQIPVNTKISDLVLESREMIRNIIDKKDQRLLLIIGPCSIHDEKAAMEYADRLNELRERYKETLCIVMRVYFEKPRTTIGWKGLINDPHMNGTYEIQEGLLKARRILFNILDKGLPAATEFLDPFIPQYLADLVSWAAIGARTTESQTHRQMASGLSMPIGFKNSTSGNTQVAVDAMVSAKSPHHFLGIDDAGQTSLIKTRGNPHGHMVLRGGDKLPNYEPESVKKAMNQIRKSGLDIGLIIDCSHANSGKKHENQEVVWNHIVEQRSNGNQDIIGMMLESHINAGNQKVSANLADLKYGVSITDACVDLKTTARLLAHAHDALK